MKNKPKPSVKKVVLAYSGGLDTSVIVPWLKENYGCEVVCFCADVGQGDEDLAKLEDKAIKSGASEFIIHDMKEEFVGEYLFPMLKAGAVYEHKYLLGTSVARPLIAKHLVEVARQTGADAIAHGATGKGNDQVRFELTVMALDPRLKIIAPWREWEIRSREDALNYAAKHNVPVTATIKSIYSRDSNLWHLSHEGGLLEDPWNEPEEVMYQMSTSPENAPDEPEYVEIEFESGNPVAVNGEKLSPAKIVETLNAIGGAHGIGRVDLVENRLVGMKSHGVYETPGGAILLYAHRELESLILDRETLQYKQIVAVKYAELTYNGLWFTPLREALDAFVNATQGPVTGAVRLKLYKGNLISAGRKSPFSLYREDFATFGQEDVYDQSHAEGFIRLYGLSLKVRALNGLPVSGLDMPKPDYSKFKRD
ncbi:MAG: argininosuccinate synthase [Chloroflexi bacterium]|nr:argininosuccinate synthase [Chloroflexi bacterium CFX1]MCK6566890.1 argininosuccinate synthase [Anaerolineales bacterium]MCQ3953180.1 argininosuccinate synthase [Chloroflexota bacterium]MDL1920175.1 argininosuccinate synthase [Chloroflexi bacterium CFX5]NUQ59834.1 argininosuccinate synthase [Anaerolineales bacterium]